MAIAVMLRLPDDAGRLGPRPMLRLVDDVRLAG